MSIRFWLPKKTKPRVTTQKSHIINGEILPYTLTISKIARHLRLTVYRDGRFAVTAPHFLRDEIINAFILEKSDWIASKIAHFKTLPTQQPRKNSKKDYEEHKERARLFVHKKILQLNVFYNFTYNEVRIKNQTTLWGSCSRKGNLNFNYKIIHLPEKLADYIVVHELCHLKELNHGKEFWTLVAKRVPDYKKLREELRATSFTLE